MEYRAAKTGFCSNAKGASTTGVRIDSKFDFNINTAWYARLGPIGPADADILVSALIAYPRFLRVFMALMSSTGHQSTSS